LFRLAHVTDPHFRGFHGARVGDFLGKRAVGALNLVVNRRRKHKMELLDALGEDLRHQNPDHLVLTGDLSNVSLDAEWRAALRWIEAFAAGPDATTVIPGNHDAYVPEVVASGAFEALFGRYQTDDAAAVAGDATATEQRRGSYPFVRLRGPLALVALNSCVATGDLGAWGEIGAEQLSKVEAALISPAARSRKRIVLLHHPPVRQKGGEDRNLKDRKALSDLLVRVGADLVLHGHDHQDENATLRCPNGSTIPVVGAGSASYAGGAERRARYNIYEFDAGGATMIVRAHDEASDIFREARRVRLA
jgi:3',5'-cyclic AMP phosphodiesterase CpdA